MLQDTYYVVVIVLGGMAIIFLVTVTFVVIKLYRLIAGLLQTAQQTAGEVSGIISELGERSNDLLRLTSKEGQKAIKTSTIVSLLMNTYFFMRTIFGNRKSKQ